MSHVLPVSDDGGSTAEIVRVLGGPAVGDIRSRCLRLADDDTQEARAVKALLGHRLSPHDAEAAKMEWCARGPWNPSGFLPCPALLSVALVPAGGRITLM